MKYEIVEHNGSYAIRRTRFWIFKSYYSFTTGLWWDSGNIPYCLNEDLKKVENRLWWLLQ